MSFKVEVIRYFMHLSKNRKPFAADSHELTLHLDDRVSKKHQRISINVKSRPKSS